MFLQFTITFQNTIQVTPYHIYSHADCKYTKDGLQLKYMGLCFVHVESLSLSPVQYFQCVPDNLEQSNNL
jgi:hypothetical protein